MKPKIILAAMILSGSTQVLAAPAPVSEAASSQSSIEKRLASLENMMQSRNLLQVELQQQLNLLQDEVSQIRGVTEEQSYKLEKVLQRQRELYQEIENRVSQAYTQPATAPATDYTQSSDAQTYSSDLSENEAYERAVALIMKDKRYDQAIVLPNSWKSALIPWFAKIPLRTGWLGEYRYGLLNDARKLDKQALPMMVERFVALAHPASLSRTPPVYEAPLMLAEPANEAINPKRQSDGQKRLILCPGAEFGPAKQWPTSHYAALADFFLTSGWQVLILGSKADVSTAEEIIHLSREQSNNLISLAGLTKLEEAIDLLGTADQVVSNDSGLMHIAAALQVPLVVVYGPTSPAFTPPLASNAHITQIDIECSPCFKRTCPLDHHNCMKQLSVDSVIELIKTTL